MKSATHIDDQLLYDAAAGDVKGLADWINNNKTLDGIPMELIEELIRNSKGCKKDILVSDSKITHYAEVIGEESQIERYISKKSGVLKFYFKGSCKSKGRPKSAHVTKKQNEIMARYQQLRATKKKRDEAYFEIAQEFHMAISSVESLIKEKKRSSAKLRKTLQQLNSLPARPSLMQT